MRQLNLVYQWLPMPFQSCASFISVPFNNMTTSSRTTEVHFRGDVYPTGANVRRAPATGPFRHRGLIENPGTLAEGQDTPGRSGKGSQRTLRQPEAKPKHTQRATQKRPVPRQQTHQQERKGRTITRKAFARDKPNSGQARLL